ncbi:MAG: hypothetical protein IH627_08180 [Rubrivivax sp.]|nr:hypothetical protein [Rubrivivax sp.]
MSAPTLAREDLGNGWGPNALEISPLPNYCQAFFSKNHKVFDTLSRGCDGVHHLCAGKVLINRVMNVSIPKGERRRILGQAKIEVNYLASRLTPTCKLGEDVRTAESQIRMLETLLK